MPSSREQEMLALRAAGTPLAEIGRRYGVSRQRVAQIIDASDTGRVPRTEVEAVRRQAEARRVSARADEVLEQWRRGDRIDEIATRVQTSHEAVRELVAARASDSDRHAREDVRRAKLAAGRQLQFTDEQLFDGLRQVADHLGHTPTHPEYKQLAVELNLASFPTVYARFGGWRPALRAAGFAVPSNIVRPRRWDVAECWRAVVSVRDQLGDPPSYKRYERLALNRDDLPSGSTVRLRLGLWPQVVAALEEHEVVALREAGWLVVEIANRFETSPGRVTRIICRAGGVDRDRCLAARRELVLARARERSGEILERYRAGADPQATAAELGLDHRAVKRVIKEARTEADRLERARAIAARQQPKFSDTQLLHGLRVVVDQLSRVPTAREYDRLAAQLALASSATVSQRFDGWRSALHAAGLNAPPPLRWSQWDADACWRALESVAGELGDPPRYRRYLELARNRDGLPSAGVVLDRLGLWSQIAVALRETRTADRLPRQPSERTYAAA